MLFVTTPPIQTQIFEDRKIIVLTNNKIMFSHLDFIEQYLAMPLITTRPKKMCYEPSVMQAMVVSETTVEVYYCDWKTQIKLIRVIILNNETVDGICYEKESGWHIFGSLAQYQPVRINFHKSREIESDFLAKCYVDRNKYILTSDKLQKAEGVEQFKEVAWKDRMMVLRNSNFKIELRGAQTLDKKKDVLCINQTYILLVSKFEVLQTFMEPVVVYMKNSLLISNVERGRLTTIQKCENNVFVELGTIQKENSQIKGAFIYDDELALLEYEDREIHLRNLPLISEADNTQNSKKGKKKLSQSISRIMQESQQDGSQFVPRQEKQSLTKYPYIQASQKAETHYSPNVKPVIRDIEANDDELKSNQLNESASEVLSRSGIEGEKQSHINDLSGCEEELSFQAVNQKKSNEDKGKNSKSVPFRPKRQYSDNFKSSSVNNKPKNRRDENGKKFENSFNEADISNVSKQSKKNKHKTFRNQSFQNVSHQENGSFEDHAQTPAFGFDVFGTDRWGQFDKQWNQAAENQINQEEVEQEMQQSLCITEEKSILKFMPQKQSKKVQVFKPEGAILTTQLYNKIDKSTYCSLISKAIEHDPDKIQQYMDMFITNVLDEAQAPLFFEKNIRTFNPQFTQDKIRTMFKSIIDKPQMKEKITSALQLFKISQVPQEVLPYPMDFIKIILILCREIYIQDLLKPTESTIDYILSSYFNIDNFRQEIVTIEDEEIDITHPRNMLNILLYLNQYLGVKIQIAIKIYCAKLLEEDHLDILKKITVKENIFEICEVPRSILDDVVVERFNQLLNESVENAEYLWSIIEFLNPPLLNQYRIRLAIITEFNKCNIIFDLTTFIHIKQFQNDIFLFLEKIISQNSSRNLANLKFSSIYRSLYWIQENERVTYVTYEYIELVKCLAEKFCEKKMFYEGFHLLNTVLSKIKMSFVAKMLKTYLKSKFLNRLGESEMINLESIFPELMNSPDIDPIALANDKVKIPQFSSSLSCSWGKFLSIFDKHLEGPLELKVFVFTQIIAAHQLYSSLDQNSKQKFMKFLAQIQDCIIVELDDINENDDSLNPKGTTSLLFEDNHKEDVESQIATSTLNREDVLLGDDQQKISKKIVYKSMTLIDHFNQISSHKLIRRNSDKKYNSDSLLNENEDLLRVRLLVNRKEIIEQLRQIYMKKEQGVFMHSLKLIDLEKVQLHHLDVFKAIFYKEIDYSVSRILPFQIFLTPDFSQAFELCREKIVSQINVRNFWIIFAVMELLFKKGAQVCSIFIHKSVIYLRNDNYASVIGEIVKIVKPKFDFTFLSNMIEEAKGYGLILTSRLLEQYNKG